MDLSLRDQPRRAAGKQCKWLIKERIGNTHFPGADKVQCMSHVVFDTDMQEDDDNPIEHTDGLTRPRIQTIVSEVSSHLDSNDTTGGYNPTSNHSLSAGLSNQTDRTQ
ncbi:hypothetical protein V6N11_051948 [Hibiscus sabdariffa]|uniref:Uncharacterized protein n=1 Tax=Hibiscus sabdariffa TaxID=183260 RepID=A0ABR2U8I8_9ROSI